MLISHIFSVLLNSYQWALSEYIGLYANTNTEDQHSTAYTIFSAYLVVEYSGGDYSILYLTYKSRVLFAVLSVIGVNTRAVLTTTDCWRSEHFKYWQLTRYQMGIKIYRKLKTRTMSDNKQWCRHGSYQDWAISLGKVTTVMLVLIENTLGPVWVSVGQQWWWHHLL